MSYSLENTQLLKKAPYFSVAVAVLICIIKSYCWIVTDSVALFASLIDSLLDFTSSIINLVALRLALAPPDHNHRFGHNKIEDLAVFGQSIFITMSGLFAAYSSGKHLISPDVIENSEIGIYSMMICSTLTILLVIYQSYVIRKTHSHALKAEKLHYLSDLMTDIVVIASLYFSSTLAYLDAIFGMVIACYVLYGSYRLFVKSIRNLVDEEFDDEGRNKILDIVSSHKEVLGIHDMKTRYAANKPFIQFHLEMDGDMTLSAVHEVSDRIMHAISQEFHGAEIIIHQDPAGVETDVPYIEILRR